MSVKDNFTPEEWKSLLRAPMLAGYAVAGAAPSKQEDFVWEMAAVADRIVTVSAHCEGRWREEVLAAGAVECFGKPIEFGLLGEILGRYAARGDALRRPPEECY